MKTLALTTVLLLAALPVQAADALQRLHLLAWHEQYQEQAAIDLPLEAGTSQLELRPDLSWQQQAWRLELQPRLAASTGDNAELWLNQAHASWQRGNWSVRAGRSVLLWGPSLFWTLSNRLWPDNGRDNAQRELAGHTLAQLDFTPDSRWLLQAAWQADHGHEPSEARRQEQVGLLRAEWVGNNGSGGLVLSRRAGEQERLGAWGQYTLSDGLVIYGDSDWGRREGAGVPGLPLQSGARLSALAGASWTWENGLTLNLEWLQHGLGLSASEYHDWQSRWQALPPAARGQMLDSGLGPLGRRHVALQLMDSRERTLGWIVRASHGVDDDSGEALLQLNWTPGERWQAWANILASYGSSGSDYRRGLDGLLWLGITLYWR